MEKFLEIGKIVAAHGIRGEIRVDLWCDHAAFAKQFRVMYLGGSKTPLSVSAVKPRGASQITLKAAGIDSPEAAQKLVGSILYFDRADVALPDGVYFQTDLIGLTVRDADSGAIYGTVSDVFETGSNDVYEVKTPDGREVLLPAIRQVIIGVDLAAGVMTIRPLEGLFDDAD